MLGAGVGVRRAATAFAAIRLSYGRQVVRDSRPVLLVIPPRVIAPDLDLFPGWKQLVTNSSAAMYRVLGK